MNEFERVQLHPHLHGLVDVYGDFFHVIFRGTIYSLLQDAVSIIITANTLAKAKRKIKFPGLCTTGHLTKMRQKFLNSAGVKTITAGKSLFLSTVWQKTTLLSMG